MEKQKINWVFEPSHCKLGFSVRHFGISETEGFFRNFKGLIDTGEKTDLSDARIDLTVDVASIDTQDAARDAHLRSADFFHAEKFPTIHFVSTGTEALGKDHYRLLGHLTMMDITKPISLDVEFGGIVEKDPFGNTKAGFLVTGRIHRKDWGITWNAALDHGGIAVGESVKITCHIELLRS